MSARSSTLVIPMLSLNFKSIVMAERAKFSCSLCDKHYDFRSRYDRHLANYGRRILEDVVKHQDNDLHLESEHSQSDHRPTELQHLSRIL